MANALWNQYAGGTARPTSAPAAAPTPAPRISKPQPTFQEDRGFFGKIKDFGRSALDKIIKAMDSPKGQVAGHILTSFPRFISGGIKAGDKKEIERLKAEAGPGKPWIPEGGRLKYNPFTSNFIKGGLSAVTNPAGVDPWGSGFLGSGSILQQREEAGLPVSRLDKAVGFAGEVLTPTLADIIPVGKVSRLLGKGIQEIPGVTKLGQQVLKPLRTAGKFIKKSKAGSVIETLSPGFKAPGAKKILDAAKDAANRRVNQLHKVIRKMADDLTPAQQRIVGELMENTRGLVTKADEPLRRVAQQMNDLADEVGREGVELFDITKGKIGLNPESFEKLKGQYLPHIWNDLIKKGDTSFITEEAPKLLGNFWKKRTGKTGFVKEFAPASFKGLGTQIAENEIARGYLAIAEKFGIKGDEALKMVKEQAPGIAREFGYAPDEITKLGVTKLFDNVALPKEVIEFIQGTTAKTGTTAWDKFWKLHDKGINAWKLGKTIYNPAYHVRNIISNQILANMATGGSLTTTVVDSFKNMLKYLGKSSDNYVSAAEDISLIRKASLTDGFKILMEESGLIQQGNVRKWGSFWKNFQNSSEDIAKLSVFKRSIDDIVKVGARSLDEVLADPVALKAAKDVAEEAIFSPYKIGAGERSLMSRIIPFYSFSRQAIPFTFKTAIKHPERLAKYPRFKQAVEAYGDDVVPQEDRPEWQKAGIQLPFKSKSGEPIALDTSYLYPWGSLDESPGTSLSRGQLPLGLSLNPFAMEVAQQFANKDFYFDREIAPSKLPGTNLKDITSTKPRRAGSQRWAHAANTLLPSLYRTYFGKLKPAFEGVPDYAGRDRDVWMALFDSFGLKTTVLRPDDKIMFDLFDQTKELKEIKSQMYSTAADQGLDDDEKKELLDDYVKEIEKLLQ